MKLQVLLVLSLAAICWGQGFNPDRKTPKAGEQDARAEKVGDGGSIRANQVGGRKGSGTFSGTANSKTAGGAGMKADAKDKDKILAMGPERKDFDVLNNNGLRTVLEKKTGRKVEVNHKDFSKDNYYKAPVKTSDGKFVKSEIRKQKNRAWGGEAETDEGDKYKFALDAARPQQAEIFENGVLKARVSNLQQQDDIEIERMFASNKLPKKATAKAVERGNQIDTSFGSGIFQRKSASLAKDASRASIKDGLTSADSAVDKGRKEATLGGTFGGFLRTGNAKMRWKDAKESDCKVSDYTDRVKPGTTSWKYSEQNGFDINFKRMRVQGKVDESGRAVDVDWPQCMNVVIPISFPRGTTSNDLKNMGAGLSINFPGCPRFTCAGRVCGQEFASQAGTKVFESCWTDSLCSLKPVPRGKEGDDIVAYVFGNAKTDACTKPFNGGTLLYGATVCPHEDERRNSYKSCSLFDFNPMPETQENFVSATVRLYDKRDAGASKNSGIFGGLFGGGGGGGSNILTSITDGLTSCGKYWLSGCRTLNADVTISAFGLSDDTYRKASKTGSGRGSGGSSRGGGWSNLWGGNKGGGRGGGGGGEQPPPRTEAPTTTTTTTQATTTRRQNNWWSNLFNRNNNRGGGGRQTNWWNNGRK